MIIFILMEVETTHHKRFMMLATKIMSLHCLTQKQQLRSFIEQLMWLSKKLDMNITKYIQERVHS